MKTVIPRQVLQDALSAIASLTSGRTTKPVLAGVRLSAMGTAVELCGTDGEAALKITIPALSTPKPGECVLPNDRLLGIIRELPDVEVTLDSDDRKCAIRGEGSAFHLYTMNVADFPPMPSFDGDPDMTVDGAELRRMIGLTIYAAAKETSRYAINGILWEKTGKRLFLVATDGRRLSRAGGPVRESKSGDFQAILPAKAMSVFERVFTPKGDDWAVQVKIMPNQVFLRSGDAMLSTVLVEGHFPKYQDVIPKGQDKRARLNRDEFLSAVRRAALLTTEESRAVKLAFDRKTLVISSQAPEHGDARVEIPISLDGEPVEIGFNPAFLSDALRAVPYEAIFIDLQDGFKPGVLCGEDKNDFLYVVMPVSLSA